MENANVKYICPMHCEGNKVYDQPGICPVCNMKLVAISAGSKEETTSHNHIHQNHKQDELKNENSHKNDRFYCPMHCEGDKVYDKPGDCPVCGMHLKKVENKRTAEVIYTCPMHPEIRQNQPGNCPKCGMTLIPEKGVETSDEEMAYKNMLKKFRVALMLSVPIFVISMSEFIPFLNFENRASKGTL